MNRRDFLKDGALLGMLATVGGCLSAKSSCGCRAASGSSMAGYADKPLGRVRVAFVGVGSRGTSAVHRISMIPGVDIVALCDCDGAQVKKNQEWLKSKKLPPAKEYGGQDGWKDLCQADGIDVVYACVPWELHAPVAKAAMLANKHALVEVPAAMTVDECWDLVETSEKTRRNCMMLENCCYGENEMLALNMTRLGVFGEIVYGEAGYLHYGTGISKLKKDGDYSWRQKWYQKHVGNIYPTHGLGPVALCLNINRGDQFDYLTSVETASFGPDEVAGRLYPDASDWRHRMNYQMGDLNNSLIRTKKGKSILLQLNMFNPRPYSRINTVLGTRGILMDYPLRIAKEQAAGLDAGRNFDAAKTEEYRQMYKHPMWKVAGEVAAKVGGHGGMDFIMDLRWIYALQNGLPLDMDVYDLAAWSCLFEISERSVRSRSMPIDVPDFTRGAWKTAKPLVMGDIDLAKMGISLGKVESDKAQQTIGAGER